MSRTLAQELDDGVLSFENESTCHYLKGYDGSILEFW